MIRLKSLLVEFDNNEVTYDKTNLTSVLDQTGYAKTSAEYILAKIIGTQEGWVATANAGKGSRAYRNNNPGNLMYQDSFTTIDPKVVQEPKGKYAKFSSPVLGAKALIDMKIKKWAGGDMPSTSTNLNMTPKYVKGEKPTIKQFMYTYAPPSENNTENYIKTIIDGVKSTYPKVSSSTKVYDILTA